MPRANRDILPGRIYHLTHRAKLVYAPRLAPIGCAISPTLFY
jgi:hypothetical protein